LPPVSAYLHQVRHLVDHAAHGRRVLQLARLIYLLQTQAEHGVAVRTASADRAADQGHFQRLLAHGIPSRACVGADHGAGAQPRISSTVLPRLAAISAGVFRLRNASSVARTMLYGFDEPWLLATTLLTPITSNTARIGPPAMM